MAYSLYKHLFHGFIFLFCFCKRVRTSGKCNSLFPWVLLTHSSSQFSSVVRSLEQVGFASSHGLGRELPLSRQVTAREGNKKLRGCGEQPALAQPLGFFLTSQQHLLNKAEEKCVSG